MERIVYLSFPARGHINPTLAVMRELIQRGEHVVYFSTEQHRRMIQDTGALFRGYAPVISMPKRGPGPFARVSTTLETLLEFSGAILNHHLEQVRALCPTHIMYDSFAPWGSFFAQILQLPSFVSVPSILINPEIHARYGSPQPEDPKLTPEWYAAFRTRCQALPNAPLPAQLLQTYGGLNIVYTSRLFQPLADTFDEPRFQFVGPCFDSHENATGNPDGKPLVLISLGTVYGDQNFFRRCTDELAETAWRVIILNGEHPQASQIELLRQCAAFVTHGGMNSVQEALFYGVPMVLAPQAADQFWISARVAELGAGVLLNGRTLRESIADVMCSAHYANAAERIAASLRAAGGHLRAADAIQSFMASKSVVGQR